MKPVSGGGVFQFVAQARSLSGIHANQNSHASLLVEMGFSPLLIAERLGHERVQTTMETYSHIYPNKQTKAFNRLDSVMR